MNLVIAGAEYIEKVAFVCGEGGALCCKVEMKLALSKKRERNPENVPEPWRGEEEEEEGETLPLISSSPPTKKGIKETPVV